MKKERDEDDGAIGCGGRPDGCPRGRGVSGDLFSYFEYTGEDFEADMREMAPDPKAQEWRSHTDPMQIPPANRPEGQWRKTMEEVDHLG